MEKIINPNTPDFVPLEQRIGIDRYIGENEENVYRIENAILSNRAVLIDAPTNSGKSTVMGQLFNKWINNEGRRCYYLLPKLIQQQQFKETYLQGFPVINGTATDEERKAGHMTGANITWAGFLQGTYDEAMTEDDIVIIDEAHLLVNSQSFIADQKHLVKKLQRGKFKIVLLSGTPNYIAFKVLFGTEIISFYFKERPVHTIKPWIISGKMMNNITHYLRSLDFSSNGLHIVRINDKEKHQEILKWATENLNLKENEIQIINKDIADPRFISSEYQYLIENDAIHPEKKLLLATIFADEAISIKNTNIRTIAIFYDPKQAKSSQRCRDSVIQFTSRFRNLTQIEGYEAFTINLFLPEFYNHTETLDFFQILQQQNKDAGGLLSRINKKKKEYGRSSIMQSFPDLFNGTHPQANLVLEVGDFYYEKNLQGIYYNTKASVDRFKSNDEYLAELSPYFQIAETEDYLIKTSRTDLTSLKSIAQDRLHAKVEIFRPLKETPEAIFYTIAKQSRNQDLLDICKGYSPDIRTLSKDVMDYHPVLIKSIEDEATKLLFLKSLTFPADQFAGLLIHKKELRNKFGVIRYLLSRAAGSFLSMDSLYYQSVYFPLQKIVEETAFKFAHKGFFPKTEVTRWISINMPYPLRKMGMDANSIINEFFETEQKRVILDGKKQYHIEIQRKRELKDVVLELLLMNEQHYPSTDELKEIAGAMDSDRLKFNVKQSEDRANQGDETTTAEGTIGQARVRVNQNKAMFLQTALNNPDLQSKAETIAISMVQKFISDVHRMQGMLERVEAFRAEISLSNAA